MKKILALLTALFLAVPAIQAAGCCGKGMSKADKKAWCQDKCQGDKQCTKDCVKQGCKKHKNKKQESNYKQVTTKDGKKREKSKHKVKKETAQGTEEFVVEAVETEQLN